MTENIGISLLIAVIGCFVGLAGWLKSRDGKIANDAEWKGQVNAKLDGILGIRSDVETSTSACGSTTSKSHQRESVRILRTKELTVWR